MLNLFVITRNKKNEDPEFISFPRRAREENPKVLELVRNQRCIICNTYGVDPDHIVTRGAGGGDTGDNVWPLCRAHHTERHTKGLGTFVSTYQEAQDWLLRHERTDILAKYQKQILDYRNLESEIERVFKGRYGKR